MASPSRKRWRGRGWRIAAAAWRAWFTPARVVGTVAVAVVPPVLAGFGATALLDAHPVRAGIGGALTGMGLAAAVVSIALLVNTARVTKRLPKPDWRSGSLVESALDDDDVVTADSTIIEDLRRTADISITSAPLALLAGSTSVAALTMLLTGSAVLGAATPAATLPLVFPALSAILILRSTAVSAGRADAVMRALRDGEVRSPG